jgi:hypothetical protein
VFKNKTTAETVLPAVPIFINSVEEAPGNGLSYSLAP